MSVLVAAWHDMAESTSFYEWVWDRLMYLCVLEIGVRGLYMQTECLCEHES